jgi:L-phenylalanine/L-methionine N-acetyltransferase
MTPANSVHLRGPRKSDVSALSIIMSKPGVLHGFAVMPFISEFDVEHMLKSTEARHWIVAEHTESVAGFAYLDWGKGRWRQIALLAMGVDDQHVGQGVGKTLLHAVLEVGFHFLDFEKIELVVYVDNLAAIALYESAGFIREGTKRHNAIRSSCYVDAHVMSLLKQDWLLRQQSTQDKT